MAYFASRPWVLVAGSVLSALAVWTCLLLVGPSVCYAQGEPTTSPLPAATPAPSTADSPTTTPLPVPCSSAATFELVEACIYNLTYTHLGYEETRQWDELMGTLAPNAYELQVPTFLGGVKWAPETSAQSLYYMYSRIEYLNVPPSMTYVPVAFSVGPTTIVIEYIAKFNHTSSFFLLPYPATNRSISVPLSLSIGFDQNNKMLYEREYWDAASVLVQAGILKDGFHVYKDDHQVSEEHACLHELPVLGDQSAILLQYGYNASGLEFNKFFTGAHEHQEASTAARREEPASVETPQYQLKSEMVQGAAAAAVTKRNMARR